MSVRGWFGGGPADVIVSTAAGGLMRVQAGTLYVWSAETGGVQYTDLLLDGVAVSTIPVPATGQVPDFQGPSDVFEVWVSAGVNGVRIRLTAREPIEDDANVADKVANGPLTKAALSATYASVVAHGSTAGTARPAGAARVLWAGTVTPTNATDGDTYLNTATGDQKVKVSGSFVAINNQTFQTRPSARWKDTVVAQHLPVSHRNSYNLYPENTLEGMRAAINAGARVFKMDVQPLADGQLAIMHDSTVNRTCTTTGNTTDFSTTDFQNLVVNAPALVGPGYTATLRPPLLTDVLDAIGGKVTLILESKTNGNVIIPQILDAVTKRGLNDTVMITGNVTSGTGFIATAHAAGCGAMIYWNNTTAETPNPSVASIIAAGPDAVGIGLQYTDAQITSVVTAAHAAGIVVCSFSINRRADRDRSIALGVDQYQTNCGPYTDNTLAQTTKGFISRGLALAGLTHNNTPIGSGTPVIPDWTGTAGNYAYKICGLGAGVDYLALGFMCPIGSDPSGLVSATNYTITSQVTIDVLDADVTRWAVGFVVCAPDDRGYNNANGAASGYHCILRYNGTVDIYRITAGAITDGVRGSAAGPVQVATQTSTALTAGQTLTVTIQVTPTQIIFKRTDTNATATATDSTYRDRYLHVGGASTGLGQASVKSVSVA